MQKIVRVGVFSDTHHDVVAIERIVRCLCLDHACDMLCFLGDCTSDLTVVQKWLRMQENQKICVYAVRGNNDFVATLPDEISVHVGGKKILLVHGHHQRVKQHKLQLLLHAQEEDADIVLFGHTHCSESGYEQGILFINPGAGCGIHPTCALLAIDGEQVYVDILSV